MDVRSNADEVGEEFQSSIMLYPSGLVMAKGVRIENPDKTDHTSYTKHYYIGSEHISAKTGTVTDLGFYPKDLLTEHMPDLLGNAVRPQSNTTVADAGTALTEVYTRFQLPAPPLDPQEESSDFYCWHQIKHLNYYYFHPDHLGSSSYITDGAGVVTQHMEYMPFGETLVDEHTNSFNSPFKFNGKEYDEETGNYYYGARYYDPKWSIFISVDPLAEVQPDKSAYHYCSNNPIVRTDPTGMLDGDYYDKYGKYLGNDGIDDNKVYQLKDTYRARFENKEINWGETLGEKHYKELQSKSNDLGTVTDTKMTFTGNANPKNHKQADGTLNIIQVAGGKEFTRASYNAVGGPWGNGSPENGDYLVNNFSDRGPNSNRPNGGMTKEGIGFSLDLIPQFKTGRSLLRIHPDGGKFFGTQGCIGLTCGKEGLQDFQAFVQDALSTYKNIPLNINIRNNPNNNGYGKKVKSNGE